MSVRALLGDADQIRVPLRYTLDGWATTHALAAATDPLPVAVTRRARWQAGIVVRPSRETPGAYRVDVFDLVCADPYRVVTALRVKVDRHGALVEPGDEYVARTHTYRTLDPGSSEHAERVASHLRWIGYILDYERRRHPRHVETHA